MSVHAMIAAAYLEDLPQTTKLVLMAAADSSDEQTLEAAPGLPKLRAWSGLGRRRVLAIVAELEAAGFLEKITPAHRGRRAVWRVFPTGVPAIPHPSEVAARYADESVPNVETGGEGVDNPLGMGATGDTLSEGMGAISGRMGATANAPLQSSTSVSIGANPAKPAARRVDNAPPARSHGSGFPGARRSTDEADVSAGKRARGGHDQPCPVADHGTRHGEIAGACGRCAHAAATSDPAKIDQARKAARKALRQPTAPRSQTA